MNERAIDVVDVSRRVISILTGKQHDLLTLEEPALLFSDDFTPSETAQIDRAKVLALAASEGSANSHTAIFARTMGIPAVIGLGKEDMKLFKNDNAVHFSCIPPKKPADRFCAG